MRVLLVENDPTMAKGIGVTLTRAGLEVRTTGLGKEALGLAGKQDYDLILLELDLPDMRGHDLVRRLRMAEVDTPILVLSKRDDPVSKLEAFALGADDYLSKPFHHEELLARIKAVIGRSTCRARPLIRTGKIAVNLDAGTVDVAGAPVHLTAREYQIFELLNLRKGITLTKEMFLNHLYGGIDEPEPKIIDVMICKLRKKLSAATGGDNYIETVWGRGYILRDPETVGEPEEVAAAA
jgi:two-component system, cell cycle response regulator CtrA